jgi:xanthine dehydrogenase accessory factor
MQKRVTPPDFRGLARMTAGLGPGFTVNVNCDAAIETRPAETGAVIRLGKTAAADGVPRTLCGAGRERFVYSGTAGNWRTAASIGTRVQKGEILGHLGGAHVEAPLTGTLRGIARDGTWLPAAVKLLEIDPRLDGARWTGMEPRARIIAEAVLDAAGIVVRRSPAGHHLSLVRSS